MLRNASGGFPFDSFPSLRTCFIRFVQNDRVVVEDKLCSVPRSFDRLRMTEGGDPSATLRMTRLSKGKIKRSKGKKLGPCLRRDCFAMPRGDFHSTRFSRSGHALFASLRMARLAIALLAFTIQVLLCFL